jgi:hypothetical protein
MRLEKEGFQTAARKHLRVLCCEVLFREVCALAACSKHTLDIVFLPKGLHDLGHERMLARIQQSVDDAPPGRYDAVILVYGLCNNGVVGLAARHTPLVVPKAHDCITLFLGGRRRYSEVFAANPGTYFKTTGWCERNDASGAGEATVPQRLGLFLKRKELVEKYGEENADYILETMGSGVEHYSRLAFIRMGIPGEVFFEELSRAEADGHGWTFEPIEGSMDLLARLLNGPWNDDFLVVPPGHSIAASYDDAVMRVLPTGEGAEQAQPKTDAEFDQLDGHESSSRV